MALRVGITGGIGAGKSLVAEIFKTFGIPVYASDLMAKKLMSEDPGLKAAIQETFGPEAYRDDDINRPFIASKVFEDKDNLTRINELVHPVVIKDYDVWERRQHGAPYTIKEAALLFESGSFKDLDRVILVIAPKNLRIQRVLMRDIQRTREDIEHIIASQMSDMEKKKRSDYVIVNDGQNMVIPQVLDIHRDLLQLNDPH